MGYRTGQVARMMGVHPNTVRLYESLGLISPAKRQANGYRCFNDDHILQFRIARLAFRSEVLQNGLRRMAADIAKAAGVRDYSRARDICGRYLERLAEERAHAEEAALIAEKTFGAGEVREEGPPITRKVAAEELGISVDTLRNWEANGLLTVKRKANGYRVYSPVDMDRLHVIRSLRCANYSLASILRLLRSVDSPEDTDVRSVLGDPSFPHDVVTACDHLIAALVDASADAREILALLDRT